VDSDALGRRVAADRNRFFLEALRWFPAVSDNVRSALAMETRLYSSGPFDRPTRAVVADGAALVGDAAGYFDPFTGQGIYQALSSGEMLAEELHRGFMSGHVTRANLSKYAHRRAALVQPARRLQHVIDRVLSSPRGAEMAVRRLARAPALADALIAVTGDLLPVRALLSPAVLVSMIQ
jgi:menaquinone-9 beta-reductase